MRRCRRWCSTLAGSRFGQFMLIGPRLGKGNYGQVYAGVHPRTMQPVAIKVEQEAYVSTKKPVISKVYGNAWRKKARTEMKDQPRLLPTQRRVAALYDV